jgi:hypothetical protein
MDTPEKKVWVNEAQRQGDFTNNFSIYTYSPQNIYKGLCKCIFQIFTLASCKCKKKYEHCNRISVNVKKLDVYTGFTCCMHGY